MAFPTQFRAMIVREAQYSERIKKYKLSRKENSELSYPYAPSTRTHAGFVIYLNNKRLLSTRWVNRRKVITSWIQLTFKVLRTQWSWSNMSFTLVNLNKPNVRTLMMHEFNSDLTSGILYQSPRSKKSAHPDCIENMKLANLNGDSNSSPTIFNRRAACIWPIKDGNPTRARLRLEWK